MKPEEPDPRSPPPACCSLSAIGRVLEAEPALEAVRYHPATRQLAMATLGQHRDAELAVRVSSALAGCGPECTRSDPVGKCVLCGSDPASVAGLGNTFERESDGTITVRKRTCPTAPTFWKWRTLRWPEFVPREVAPLSDPSAEESRKLLWLAGACFVCMLGGFAAAAAGAHGVSLSLFGLAYLAGGWDAAIDAWHKAKSLRLDIHFLMLAVAAGAASIGAWGEGALLLFLFSLSGAMEHYAGGRTRKAISALLNAKPKTARLLRDGGEIQIPADRLQAGMILRVDAGELVPADLRVLRGESSCDESNLTGEARPVPKSPGDDLLGGTVNLDGSVEAEVLRPAGESALQRIIDLIESARHLKAPSQRFTDRFGSGYTYLILGLCAGMFLLWWLAFDLPAFRSDPEIRSAFYRAMTLLVVCSPCALVLSVPSAILSAIASGARRGILFRGGAAVETLADIRVLALDKTGTLTSGQHRLVGEEVFEGTPEMLRAIAATLARFSSHPLSRAITREGVVWGVENLAATGVQALPGKGVLAQIDGKTYRIGARGFAVGETPGEHSRDEVAAEVWVGGEGLAGRFLFADQLRPEAPALLLAIRALGIHPVMLTGDREAAARELAGLAGLEEYLWGLLPGDKVEAVERLKREHGPVAMVGDGVNDAPVLAAADVGIAMGAAGADAALEQAEVILVNDRLENFLVAHRLSVRAKAVIRQNLFVALGTVAVMALATFAGIVPLAAGVAAHEGSTVLVVLNSLRLLRVPPRRLG